MRKCRWVFLFKGNAEAQQRQAFCEGKRSMLKQALCAAPVLAVLLLAGCGGSDTQTATRSQQASQGIAVGEPNGGVPVASEFVKIAQQESCSNVKNRLYLIDGKQVFWDRAGTCADNAYAQRLYGATPNAVLCEMTDTLAGPKTFCANDTVRKLFETIQANLNLPNLGLDGTHKVELIPFLPRAGASIAYETLFKGPFSGVTQAQNVVVRDQAAWDKLWALHASTRPDIGAAPRVDFVSKMVVGVFEGDRPLGCGNMGIVGISSQDGAMVVDYEERTGAPGIACPAVVTYPMQLVLVDRNDAKVEFVPHKVQLLAAAALDATSNSGVRDMRNVVVKDKDTWARLWAEHAGMSRTLPEVDFGKQMVIGVFLGNRANGCYATRIDTVSTDGKKISVRHTDSVPGPGVLCTLNVPSPAELVAVGRSDLPVEFASDVLSVGPKP
jgi:hypothetical protein